MNNDDINQFFSSIDPSDFATTTSAVHEMSLNFDHDRYEVFLDHCLAAVRWAFAATDGDTHPVAALSDGVTQRIFTPDDDESLSQYVRRLTREAKLLNATWVFISIVTSVGIVFAEDDPSQDRNVDSRDRLAEAESMGSVNRGMFWYSARTDVPERIKRRHGYFNVAGANRLGEMIEGEVEQPSALLDPILGC